MADNVNHPSHYNQGKREVIEEMRLIFGVHEVMSFCKLNAYKYMRRADYKGNKEEDMKKAEWYMDYLEKLIQEQDRIYNAPTKTTADTTLEEIRDALNKNNELGEKAVSITNETLELNKNNVDKKKLEETAQFFHDVAFGELARDVKQGLVKEGSEKYNAIYADCEKRYNAMMEDYLKKFKVSDILLDYIDKIFSTREYDVYKYNQLKD